MRQKAFTFLPSLFLLALSVPALGAESSCDSELLERAKDSKSAMAYRDRGDRCEGIYAQQVGTVTLQVRSLTWGGVEVDPTAVPAIALGWTPPPQAKGSLRLRAFSFKPRTYYRMDAAFPLVQKSYSWPTEIIEQAAIRPRELGVVAWMETPPPGAGGRVYLPVRLGVGREGKATASVVPSERLRELRVSVSSLNIDTGKEQVLRADEELDYGYYPSGQPVEFELGDLKPGFYRVKAKALAADGKGGPVIEDFVVYIAEG